MTMHDAHGRIVRVRFKNGHILEGLAYDYTPAYDNPEEKESLTIDSYEFFEDEVESIELIGENGRA